MLEFIVSPPENIHLVIVSRMEDELSQLENQAYIDYLNDLDVGMSPCTFPVYFKDWNELRILREYKENSSKGVSN